MASFYLRKIITLIIFSFLISCPVFGQLLNPEQNVNWSKNFALPGLDTGGRIVAVGDNQVYFARYTGLWPTPETNGSWGGSAIAVWDGKQWSLQGKTEFEYNTGIQAIAIVGTDVYIGGDFKMPNLGINYVARWDGTQFYPLADGLDGKVRTLASDGSNLYAGGDFTKSGDLLLNYVGKYDGFKWIPLQQGTDGGTGMNDYVYDIAVTNGGIVAGGEFSTAGGVTASHIAAYNNALNAWTNYGSGMNNTVHTVAIGLDGVYAGGDFTKANGFDRNHIARWTGSDWVDVANGSKSSVYHIEITTGGQVYASSNFFYNVYNSPAKLMGGVWEFLGDSAYSFDVLSMASMNTDLYVGYQNGVEPGTYANGLAKWDGEKWSGLGNGIGQWWSQGNTVRSFEEMDNGLYVFGDFKTAGPDSIHALARWDGQKWNAVGKGFKNAQYASGYALKANGNNLYLGGYFDKAGDVAGTMNIAKWNGSSYEALGQGLDEQVNALEMMGGDLYAGGEFFVSGDSVLRNIGRWDGATWHPLGYGLDNYVYCLKAVNNRLYVGGAVTGYYNQNLSTGELHYIFYWENNAWHDLGGGVSLGSSTGFNTKVECIEYQNGKLYIGGDFTMAGTTPANNIAMWDGENWNAMGAGLDGEVKAILANGNDIYAGGNFTTTNGDTVFSIAKWNGSSWEALGTGLRLNLWFVATARVDALYGNSDGLWVGGNFSHAGENFSHSIALWTDYVTNVDKKSEHQPGSFELKQNYPNPFNPKTTIEYSIGTASLVKLEVFDMLGRKIATLVNAKQNPGTHKVEFNGQNLSSGIYFYRITANKRIITKKLVLIK